MAVDMGGIELRFEPKWDYGLDAEMTAFKALLAQSLKKALTEVNADMQDLLKKHIETDVYKAYKPKVYERRSKGTSLGTPLSNMQGNVAFEATEAQVAPQGVGAQTRFQYLPTGEHSVQAWSGTDGDALIGRIERKSPPYDWGNEKIPERPFLQNFFEELIEGGAAEDMLLKWLQLTGATLEVEPGGGGIVRELGDGEY